MKKLTCWTS